PARLSREATENKVVVWVGAAAAGGAVAAGQAGDDAPSPPACPAVYVVLSGRLALVRDLDSPRAASEVARFIAYNYERYKLRPVVRSELEAMSIVARWLKERTPDNGKVISLTGPGFDPNSLEMRNAG